MRSAVVTMLKDEASDIAYWISWYISIGFDTVIIFDDNSTDGTDQIIIDAGKLYDVRHIRVESNTDRALVRQLSCYGEAVRMNRAEFDWMAFFDGDEYINLSHDNDINTFLSRFENADAIAVHWCNYGSNGHITKPSRPSFAAYTKHGAQHEWDHRHVKSIVRPRKISGDVVNAHSLDVPNSRYLLPNGTPVQWENEEGGFTRSAANWEFAKLMHFPVRSMEHFVERFRRREARSGMADRVFYSGHFDLIEDLSPLERLPKFTEILFQIVRKRTLSLFEILSKDLYLKPTRTNSSEGAMSLFRRLVVRSPAASLGALKPLDRTSQVTAEQVTKTYAPGLSDSQHFQDNNWISPSRYLTKNDVDGRQFGHNLFDNKIGAKFRVFSIKTFFGSFLAFKPGSSKAVHTYEDSAEPKCEPIYGVLLANLPGIIVFLTASYDRPLMIEEDERVVALQAMRIQAYGDGRVTIIHPRTGRFLCANDVKVEPDGEDRQLVIDRWRPREWEAFTLIEQTNYPDSLQSLLANISGLSCDNLNVTDMASVLSGMPKDMIPEVFPVLLAAMEYKDLKMQFAQLSVPVSHQIY